MHFCVKLLQNIKVPRVLEFKRRFNAIKTFKHSIPKTQQCMIRNSYLASNYLRKYIVSLIVNE